MSTQVELQKKGTLRALGVSNFNAVELRAFAEDPALGGLWLPDALQNKVDVYRRGEQEPGEDDVAVCADEAAWAPPEEGEDLFGGLHEETIE